MLDTSKLRHVLTIDAKRHVAVVEPNVPMDQLIEETLRFGLLPPVIPEFPGITVGGAIQGGAGESSSFRWGFFSQAVNRVTYLLADGSLVATSPNEHADLFYGGAGACGTLGVITSVEVHLIPAKRFVQLTYLPVTGSKQAIQTMQHESRKEHDFIDGIMFAVDEGIVITGKLSDEQSSKPQRFSRARDPWFYLHAEYISKKQKPVTETVPLKDYLFRYNRGAFWVGKFAYERFGVPFNAVTRFVLNPLMNTRKLYQALQESAASQEYLVQDITLPVATTELFMHFIDRTTHTYPLWLCPIKPEPRSPLLCNGLRTPLAINVGVWGPHVPDYQTFKKLNQRIEAKVAELGGKKWLYAHTYYTENEFWHIYNRAWYDKLRTKYHAETLPSIFDKVRVHKRYQVKARQGLFKAITGRAKLRITD